MRTKRYTFTRQRSGCMSTYYWECDAIGANGMTLCNSGLRDWFEFPERGVSEVTLCIGTGYTNPKWVYEKGYAVWMWQRLLTGLGSQTADELLYQNKHGNWVRFNDSWQTIVHLVNVMKADKVAGCMVWLEY